MKIDEQKELEEILKGKPATPQCSDDKSYGKCLIWTKEVGWRIIGQSYRG